MNELRVFAAACIMSGFLRAGSSFIDYESAPESIELLYMLIDIGFILGLIGFYILYRARLGPAGQFGVIIAIIGFSIIAGPEASIYGIGIYAIGSPIVGVGILLLSIKLLRSRLCGFSAPVALVGSVFFGAISMVVGSSAIFILSGILFGIGSIAMGQKMWVSS